MEDQPIQLDTKALFAPKKGKQATKGQKQIHEGNLKTIKFYSVMAGVTILARAILSSPFSTTSNTLLTLFAFSVQLSSLGAMHYMAKPVTSGISKTIVDGGIDLNLQAGFADYLKDIIITTAICTGLSIVSNFFWLLWLWLPAFFGYKIWTSMIAPWIFEQPPEVAPEIADKKRKKMERKMARSGGYR